MCLSKVTQKNVKLKKDKVVYGCVRVDSKGVQTSWLKDIILCKGLNKAKYLSCIIGSFQKFETVKGYKCGFHRFVKRSDAVDWAYDMPLQLYIVKHIIPAGTIVTYGRQENLADSAYSHTFDHRKAVVIVSPVIINPQGERR